MSHRAEHEYGQRVRGTRQQTRPARAQILLRQFRTRSPGEDDVTREAQVVLVRMVTRAITLIGRMRRAIGRVRLETVIVRAFALATVRRLSRVQRDGCVMLVAARRDSASIAAAGKLLSDKADEHHKCGQTIHD